MGYQRRSIFAFYGPFRSTLSFDVLARWLGDTFGCRWRIRRHAAADVGGCFLCFQEAVLWKLDGLQTSSFHYDLELSVAEFNNVGYCGEAVPFKAADERVISANGPDITPNGRDFLHVPVFALVSDKKVAGYSDGDVKNGHFYPPAARIFRLQPEKFSDYGRFSQLPRLLLCRYQDIPCGITLSSKIPTWNFTSPQQLFESPLAEFGLFFRLYIGCYEGNNPRLKSFHIWARWCPPVQRERIFRSLSYSSVSFCFGLQAFDSGDIIGIGKVSEISSLMARLCFGFWTGSMKLQSKELIVGLGEVTRASPVNLKRQLAWLFE